MDNRKGNGESNSNFDGEDKELDLTLTLGLSVQHNRNEEDVAQESTSATPNDMGNWNAEYGSSSAPYNIDSSSVAAYATGGYLVYHQNVFPHNTPTLPTHKRPNADTTKTCNICGSNTTPLWRKGPDGPQTLCNACGLRHLRSIKRGGRQ